MNRIASMIILLLGIATLGVAPASAQERTVTLKVTGMTCGTCPISVRHRAMQLPGVKSAAASMESATATITYEDNEQTAQAIADAITKLGYPASIAELKP